MLYFSLALPNYFVHEDFYPDKDTVYWASLSPTVAMTKAMDLITHLENALVPVNEASLLREHRNFTV
jgi:hypothetical protein